MILSHYCGIITAIICFKSPSLLPFRNIIIVNINVINIYDIDSAQYCGISDATEWGKVSTKGGRLPLIVF